MLTMCDIFRYALAKKKKKLFRYAVTINELFYIDKYSAVYILGCTHHAC